MIRRFVRDTRGESLTETLCAMLIVALVFVFLCASVVVSAKVNSLADNADTAFELAGARQVGEGAATALRVGVDQLSVSVWQTENGYYYFEPAEAGEADE